MGFRCFAVDDAIVAFPCTLRIRPSAGIVKHFFAAEKFCRSRNRICVLSNSVVSCLCRRVSGKKGGEVVDEIATFVLSVVAGVVACYIYKWLGGK